MKRHKVFFYFFVAMTINFIINLLTCSSSYAQNQTVLKEKQFKNYNIILISLGNIGVEHMSLYGYERKTTPYIDTWAQDAFVFENAFSHGSWTLPVGTSLFTALYPYSHGIMDRKIQNRLNQKIKTFPEILQKNGYKTAAFTGGLDYDKVYSHMRGFDVVSDNYNFTGFSTTLRQAKDWLDQNQNNKFFLFIHGYDAHCPFTPPKEFKGVFSKKEKTEPPIADKYCVVGYKNSTGNTYKAVYSDPCPAFGKQNYTRSSCEKPKEIVLTQEHINHLKNRYDEEVLSVDKLIGDFLNSFDKKIKEKTIFVIFSEHGEMFDKHGRFGRSGSIRGAFYDDVMHIPLIIKTPGKQPKRIKGLAQIIDIMPTLAQLVDVPIKYNIQGKSLLPLMRGEANINEYVYAGLLFNRNKNDPSVNEFIRNRQWKLIREVQYLNKVGEKESFELYNLLEDPNELNNVSDLYPEIVKILKKKLKQWVKTTKEFSIFKPGTQEIPEDILRDAQKHGYW